MIEVKGLIWDKWNKDHIRAHEVKEKEVEEVCLSKYKAYMTYRGRIEIVGITLGGRKLKIILSPEDRSLQQYEKGIFYPITAYEEGIEDEE